MRFRAPIVEFARAIDRVPHMIAPLLVRAKSGQHLSVSDLIRRTAPPPLIEISVDSLFVPAATVGLPAEPNDSAAMSLTNELDAGCDDWTNGLWPRVVAIAVAHCAMVDGRAIATFSGQLARYGACD